MASIINATTTNGLSTSADNSGSLQLATNNGTTAVTINTSQNVGIGTSSPAYALDVRSTTAPAIRLSRSGTAGQIASMVFEDGNATLGSGSTTRVASDAGAMSFSTGGTSGAVTGGTERMRIDSAGVVSIKNTGSTADFVSETSTSLIVGNGSGTQAMTVYSGTANNGALYFADGNTGDATYRGAVQYLHGSDAMRFFTSAAERMRIDSSGNLLVGCTAIPSSSVGGSAFQVAGDGRRQLIQATTSTGTRALQEFYNPNGNVGSINTSGSATNYVTSSDYRLKNTIAPMTGALAKVAQLKPVTYKWKATGEDGQGFIAHELAEVVPDCVVGEKDAVETYTDEDGNEQTRIKAQGVDTSFLVATLTAAIQELNTDLANTKLLLTEVSNKVDAQAVRIAELEGAK